MNGKAARRIRAAARIFAAPHKYRAAVARLKREYRALPYHRRTVPPGRPGVVRAADGRRRNPPHTAATLKRYRWRDADLGAVDYARLEARTLTWMESHGIAAPYGVASREAV